MVWLCFKLPSCLFGDTRDTPIMHEKAKFVCFNYITAKSEIQICSINMKHVSYMDLCAKQHVDAKWEGLSKVSCNTKHVVELFPLATNIGTNGLSRRIL